MDLIFNIPWDRVISLNLVNFFSIASPGPALILMMNESLSKGRRLGAYCALGIALGVGVHLSYTFLGLAQLIDTTPWLKKTVIIIAILYFTLFCINLLRSSNRIQRGEIQGVDGSSSSSSWLSFIKGFIVSGINPNAIVFSITMFAPLIDPSWNLFSCFVISVWLCFCCYAVYLGLNYIFTTPPVARFYFRFRPWFDRVIALFFLYLAICFAAKLLPAVWIEPISWLFKF